MIMIDLIQSFPYHWYLSLSQYLVQYMQLTQRMSFLPPTKFGARQYFHKCLSSCSQEGMCGKHPPPCHAQPLPHTPPCHACPHQACPHHTCPPFHTQPPLPHMPPVMHAPCHICPLPQDTMFCTF